MKRFWLDCFFATIFVFVTLYGVKQLTTLKLFSAFDPLGQAIGDMDFADIAMSSLREEPPIDTNIVIVNISYLTRGQIGQQIANLSKWNPKVIGLDTFFSCDFFQDSTICPQAYDTLDNLQFSNAVNNFKNMVMVERLAQTDSLIKRYGDVAIYDSIEHTYPTLLQGAYEGFANLESEAADQEDLKTCRRLTPSAMVNGREELAFSVVMAKLYDSTKTRKFLDRKKESEVINYRGNVVDWFGAGNQSGRYPVLDWEQALDPEGFAPGMITGKIIIMGFMGSDLKDTSWDDKFFTPLNKQYAGKSRPDMYGVVVHANAVSMIINEDYVNELSAWQEYAISFIVVLLNVALFFKIMSRIPIWFDSLSLLIQVTQVILLGYLMIQMINLYSFKLNLTVTLAAVALVGTCFEIYSSVIKQVVNYGRERLLRLTKNRSITNEETGV